MSMFGGSETIANYGVKVGADISDLESTLGRARDAANGAVESIQSTVGGIDFGSIGSGIAGGFAALAGLAASAVGAFGVLSAAVETEEKANRRLKSATGELATEMRGLDGTFRDFADTLEKAIGRSDTSIMTLGAQIGALADISGPALEQATAAAEGLAAKYEFLGLNAEEAGRAVARAARGDFKLIERLGIDLGDSASGAQRYMRVITEGLSGLRDAAEDADSWAGGFRRLTNAAQDLAVSIGRTLGLGSNSGQVLSSIAAGVDWFSDSVGRLKPEVDALNKSLREMFSIDEGKGFWEGFAESFKSASAQIADGFKLIWAEAKAGGAMVVNDLTAAGPTSMLSSAAAKIAETAHLFVTGLDMAHESLSTQLAQGIFKVDQLIDETFGTNLNQGFTVDELRAASSDALEKRLANTFSDAMTSMQRAADNFVKGVPYFDFSDMEGSIDRLRGRQDARRRGEDPDFVGPPAPKGRGGEQKSALDDLIKRLDTVFSADLGEAFAATIDPQRIQTVLGELAIPGSADRIRIIQEAQLSEQREIRKNTAMLRQGNRDVYLVG